jgi:hypothetical protein
MPLVQPTSSSEITLRNQTRAIYADYIAQKQKVAQGCPTRVQLTGGASDFTLIQEGAVVTTTERQAAIVEENTCNFKYTLKLFNAIPDFTYTTNTVTVNAEPGTWQCIATDLSQNIMNGTYLTTGTHFFTGDIGDGVNGDGNASGTIRAFRRIKATDASGGWLSRTASNNYASAGNYLGVTIKRISGYTYHGEYMTITAPYSFVLDSYNLVTGHRGVNPASWVLGGSTDEGATWTTIDAQTDIIIIGNTVTIQLPLNTTEYNSYILMVTKNASSGGNNGANIDSLNLFTKLSVRV